MEFPRIPEPVVWLMYAALAVGFLVILASPFVAGWWLWHHVHFS